MFYKVSHIETLLCLCKSFHFVSGPGNHKQPFHPKFFVNAFISNATFLYPPKKVKPDGFLISVGTESSVFRG